LLLGLQHVYVFVTEREKSHFCTAHDKRKDEQANKQYNQNGRALRIDGGVKQWYGSGIQLVQGVYGLGLQIQVYKTGFHIPAANISLM
jgi:hypothetical protein